jgi:ubiquinol-cytochrome c reductase cytochrome c1 subunit
MKAKLILAAVAIGLTAATAAPSARAEGESQITHETWSFDGLFGTFDRAAALRGLQVYRQVCSACHSLNLVDFRNLEGLGLSEDQVKQIAASYEISDGPNDQGEMFKRPGRPADHFPPPFPNDQASRAANGGALPPDLSLIVKARDGGADYVYSILNGFKEPPAGFKVSPGMHYNIAFPGHQIAMPPPLSEGAVEYPDKTKATVPQMAHDVATFLAWASEPTMEVRKRTGVKVILFLLVLTGMLYAVKRKVWADIH